MRIVYTRHILQLKQPSEAVTVNPQGSKSRRGVTVTASRRGLFGNFLRPRHRRGRDQRLRTRQGRIPTLGNAQDFGYVPQKPCVRPEAPESVTGGLHRLGWGVGPLNLDLGLHGRLTKSGTRCRFRPGACSPPATQQLRIPTIDSPTGHQDAQSATWQLSYMERFPCHRSSVYLQC